jgi:uncharacterized membrane protein YoaK (UPF0700 family)
MPVPIELLRGVLAVIATFFAFVLGRTAGRVHKGEQRSTKLYPWIFRFALTAVAVWWRHGLDYTLIALIVLSAAAFAGGLWDELRERKPPEDLTDEIFPK